MDAQLSAARSRTSRGLAPALKAVSGGALAHSFAPAGVHLAKLMGDTVGPQVQKKSARDVASDGLAGAGHEVPYRQEMERSFGADFSGVRSHTGDRAEAACGDLGAQAYALGSGVAFKTASPDRATVAHELTHVLQQTGAPARKSDSGGVDTSGEAQARAVERAVAAGQPASSALSGGSGAVGDGPALIPDLDPRRVGIQFAFSPEMIRVRGRVRLWPAPGTPAMLSIPVFTGVNFVIRPSVDVFGDVQGNVGGRNAGSAQFNLGVTGSVGVGLSGGIPGTAEVYLTVNPTMTAQATLRLGPGSGQWTFDAGITLTGDVRLGVSLGGGAADFSVRTPSAEILRLTGINVDQAGFHSERLGFALGRDLQAALDWMERRLDDVRNGVGRVVEAGQRVAREFTNVAEWATSW